MKSDEFYVGYIPAAPAGIGRFTRRVVAALGCIGLAICVVLAMAQTRSLTKVFEYGVVRTWEGNVVADPYPALLLASGGPPYLLVAPGKHGLDASTLAGRIVRLRGSLIAFGNQRMIEALPGAETLGPAVATPQSQKGRRVTLDGEIVDTKCFFGVMQPGSGKVHRDCAARCILGGIPPGLLVKDRAGQMGTLLLTGSDNRPLHEELRQWIGELVRISGTLVSTRSGEALRIETRDITRNSWNKRKQF